MKVMLLCAVMLAYTLTGGAAFGSYTTVSESMKISIELDFLAPHRYYEFDGTTLSWREPGEADSHYMKVVVRDAGGTRTIAGCDVAAIISTEKGKQIGTSVTLHETWDRTLPHYGDNIQLPDDVTSADVTVKIEPPKGRRLGRTVGDFFTKPITETFKGVDFSDRPEKNGEDDRTAEPMKVEWPEGRRPYIPPTPYPGSK